VQGGLVKRRNPFSCDIEGNELAWTDVKGGHVNPVLVEWAASSRTDRGEANKVEVRADSVFDRPTDSHQYIALPLGRIFEGNWLANNQLRKVCYDHFGEPGGHSSEVAGPIPFPGEGYRGDDATSKGGSNGASSNHELSPGERHGLPIGARVVNRTVRTIVKGLQGQRSCCAEAIRRSLMNGTSGPEKLLGLSVPSKHGQAEAPSTCSPEIISCPAVQSVAN
jgi:hypothetical protein